MLSVMLSVMLCCLLHSGDMLLHAFCHAYVLHSEEMWLHGEQCQPCRQHTLCNW